MKNKPLNFFFISIFIAFAGISSASQKETHFTQTVKTLNLIILYLNTESQRSLLLPSYIHKYHREVKKHLQQKEAMAQYGPAYFSSHKNYSIPQHEFDVALTAIKSLPTDEKKELKHAFEEIHKLNITKQKLITELHHYAKEKVFLQDHFEKYFILYQQLTTTINTQKYQTIILYAQIKKIYNIQSSLSAKTEKNVLGEMMENLINKIEKNHQLQFNFSWIKTDSLLSKYTNSFSSLQALDTTELNKFQITPKNAEMIALKYKLFAESNNNWEEYYLWLSKSVFENSQEIEAYTQLILLFNQSISYYNAFLSELEKTNIYQPPYLLALEFPMEYFEDKYPLPLSLSPPNYVLFLIDASISMGNSGKLAYFIDKFSEIITFMRPEDHIALLRFNTSPKLILPFTSSLKKTEIDIALKSLKISGTTELEQGLKIALNEFQETPLESNNRIILVTDGIYSIEEQIFKLLKKNKHKNIKISVLYLGSSMQEQDNNLEKLSKTAYGNFYQIEIEPINLFIINELSGL